MGEGRSETGRKMRRYTVRDAADVLGITTGAVRNRLSRGTLRSVKEGRTVYVLLPADTPRDAERDTADMPTDTPQALVEEMRERITDLREQLAAERRANEENRRIIAALTQRIPEIDAPRESPVSPQEAAEGPGPIPPDEGPQGAAEPRERRSWWRRIFEA